MSTYAYTIVPLKEDLIYITWLRDPTHKEEHEFLKDLQRILETTPQRVYFLSDVRRAVIRTPNTLYHLAQLIQHQNCAGSTAFSGSFSATIYVGLFQRFSQKPPETPEVWPTPEQALAYLETLRPGLTEGLDWPHIFFPQSAQDTAKPK